MIKNDLLRHTINTILSINTILNNYHYYIVEYMVLCTHLHRLTIAYGWQRRLNRHQNTKIVSYWTYLV